MKEGEEGGEDGMRGQLKMIRYPIDVRFELFTPQICGWKF